MIKTLYPTFQRWTEKGSLWIISDTHFDDADCKLMDENWITPEEHLAVFNQYDRKNDTLIHLGDVGDPTYMSKIKAYKVLITGNHDPGAACFQDYFDEIYTGPLMIAEKILLSHEPLDITWAFNIHGHDHNVHNKKDEYHLNCASNVAGYTPFNMKEIINSGVLKNIKSIHRYTIDMATEKKERKKTENETDA